LLESNLTACDVSSVQVKWCAANNGAM
jgi:hypothetical protein